MLQSINNIIREQFEKIYALRFCITNSKHSFERTSSGGYFDTVLEDRWQTFQEGWEAAIQHSQFKPLPTINQAIKDLEDALDGLKRINS